MFVSISIYMKISSYICRCLRISTYINRYPQIYEYSAPRYHTGWDWKPKTSEINLCFVYKHSNRYIMNLSWLTEREKATDNRERKKFSFVIPRIRFSGNRNLIRFLLRLRFMCPFCSGSASFLAFFSYRWTKTTASEHEPTVYFTLWTKMWKYSFPLCSATVYKTLNGVKIYTLYAAVGRGVGWLSTPRIGKWCYRV